MLGGGWTGRGEGRPGRRSDTRLQQLWVVQGQAGQLRPSPHLSRGKGWGGGGYEDGDGDGDWGRRHTPHHIVPLALPANSCQSSQLLLLLMLAAELTPDHKPLQLLEVPLGILQGAATQGRV